MLWQSVGFLRLLAKALLAFDFWLLSFAPLAFDSIDSSFLRALLFRRLVGLRLESRF
ncbi:MULTISPECIES: hypothetical protein [unclassified Helicobacter]|uniref:hypothetical protein n=1 Tax=unclassified Helicobacter TaxID=2593540 RepID=UPI0012E80A89|nr:MULTISPECIES: hypothetical protein [unclassified Helicobacter]